MNEFSLICRMLGNLFYRCPDDPILAPLMQIIRAGQLAGSWPLDQNDILLGLQQEESLASLVADYQQLFNSKDPKVSPFAQDWQPDITSQELINFMSIRGREGDKSDACHLGQILLSASWLEDKSAGDEINAVKALFDNYLLPWCGKFLGKMETCATTEFYRSLAKLTRGAIQAMYDELIEADSK